MTSKECNFSFSEKNESGVMTIYCKWLSTKRSKKKCLGNGCLHFQAQKAIEENKLST
jgi:hypothetical protein